MSDPGEEWRRWIGPYEVSSLGRVRRGSRYIKPSRKADGYWHFRAWALDGVPNTYVHRAVALAFIGEPPDGMQVNHIDGDKANNAASNLEYVTQSQNMRHAYAIGLMNPATERPSIRGDAHWTRRHPDSIRRGDENGARLHPESIVRGSACKSSKLTEADVPKIREASAAGESFSSIARRYGVSHVAIRHVVNRTTWRHVQ